MGQLALFAVVVAICAVGLFVGRSMGKGMAIGTALVCWCVTLVECHQADSVHEGVPLVQLAVSALSALIGIGLFISAFWTSSPKRESLDEKAVERIAARMQRMRALEESVPDYSKSPPPNREPGPPLQ